MKTILEINHDLYLLPSEKDATTLLRILGAAKRVEHDPNGSFHQDYYLSSRKLYVSIQACSDSVTISTKPRKSKEDQTT